MNKHTPGPWDISSLQSNVIVCPRIAGENVIAKTYVSGDCANLDQADANARLIAAAPDMHEALKMAWGLIEVSRTYFPKSIQNNDRFKLENTCAAIGKAISRVEGE